MLGIPSDCRMDKMCQHFPLKISIRNLFRSCEIFWAKRDNVPIKKSWIFFPSIDFNCNSFTVMWIFIKIVKKWRKNNLGQTITEINVFVDRCPVYNIGAEKLDTTSCHQTRCPPYNYQSNDINVGELSWHN